MSRYFGSRSSSRSPHRGSTGSSSSNQWRRSPPGRDRQAHFRIYEDPMEEQISSGADIINPLGPQVASGQENIFTPARLSPRLFGERVPLQDITPERAPLGGLSLGGNATFRRPSLQALDIETLSLRDHRGNNNSDNTSSGQHRMRNSRASTLPHTLTPRPLIVLGPQTPVRGAPYHPGAGINSPIPRSSQAGADGGTNLAHYFQEVMGQMNTEINLAPRIGYINSREVDFGTANHQRPIPSVLRGASLSELEAERIGLSPFSYYYDRSSYDTGSSNGGSSTYHSTADASDATDMEATNPLVCLLCTRREATLSFTACAHNICPSCMVGTWWGCINRPNHWPSSVSCPFCRATITEVVDAGGPVVALLYYVCRKSCRARQKLMREKLELVQPPGMRAYLANMRVHYQGVV